MSNKVDEIAFLFHTTSGKMLNIRVSGVLY
jgi:hypothetical protein